MASRKRKIVLRVLYDAGGMGTDRAENGVVVYKKLFSLRPEDALDGYIVNMDTTDILA